MKKNLKKIFLSPWLAVLTFALLVFIKVSNPYLVDMGRLKFYDYLMLGKPIAANEIVLANIDEKAIAKYGQFPFPRTVYADIIKDLRNRHAALLGNTVLFLEPDRMGGDNFHISRTSRTQVTFGAAVSRMRRKNAWASCVRSSAPSIQTNIFSFERTCWWSTSRPSRSERSVRTFHRKRRALAATASSRIQRDFPVPGSPIISM
jgi:CHASE2 domain-containing sensor protein